MPPNTEVWVYHPSTLTLSNDDNVDVEYNSADPLKNIKITLPDDIITDENLPHEDSGSVLYNRLRIDNVSTSFKDATDVY